MAGAIALAGMAALRSGAGLVRLAVPTGILETVASFESSYMTVPLADDRQGKISLGSIAVVRNECAAADVIAVGPGLGRSRGLTQLVAQLYGQIQRPMVLDADALNALAELNLNSIQPEAQRVLTPHPGEFSRLTGRNFSSRMEAATAAKDAAKKRNVVIVLKGNGTIITDGGRLVENTTGNAGMATGGTGDVLTGVIAGIMGQGLEPFEAARLGVFVHGLAGDLAEQDSGQLSLIARDMIEYLPSAFQSLSRA